MRDVLMPINRINDVFSQEHCGFSNKTQRIEVDTMTPFKTKQSRMLFSASAISVASPTYPTATHRLLRYGCRCQTGCGNCEVLNVNLGHVHSILLPTRLMWCRRRMNFVVRVRV